MIRNSMSLGNDILNAGERISSKGIECAYTGKWHLDGGDYFGKGYAPKGYNPKWWYDMRNFLDELPSKEAREKSRINMGAMIFGDVKEEDTYAYRVTKRALDFIEENKDRDFFLTISYDEPHDPSQCPKKYIKELKQTGFKLKDRPNMNDSLEAKPETHELWKKSFKIPWQFLKIGFSKGFIPCNVFVDKYIGEVLSAIKEKLDNPMIIYTSDHVDMMRSHGLMVKGPCMYQEIVNVPLLISGGHFGNKEVSTPVSHLDLLPTIMEYFDLKIPKILDGESLYKLKGDHEKRDVYMQFHRFELSNDSYFRLQLIRSILDGEFKLNINLFSIDELYDIKHDPYEMHNLINDDKYAEIRNKLHDKILANMDERIDPYRGYVWATRPYRTDYKPSFECSGMTRERCEEGEIRLDYATGNPITYEKRVKGMK